MTTTTSWRLQGDMTCGCSCDSVCPCEVGSNPTKGFCDVILGFHIEQGNHGDTRLDGLNWVFYGHVPGNFFEGGFTMGAYLDQLAAPEQVDALGSILSGQAGGFFAVMATLVEHPLPPKQVPIRYEMVDGDARITVDGLLEHSTQRIRHPASGQPLNLEISDDTATGLYTGPWFPRKTTVVKLTDPALGFEYSDSHACVGKFDYSGP